MALIDLTGQTKVKFDIRASRTGSNIKVGLRNYSKISNADIDDEDMADITDWTDSDGGDGASTQVTFDSQSCMKLDSGTADAANYCLRNQDIGTFGTRTIFTLKTYFNSVGAGYGNTENFAFYAHDGTTRLRTAFASDGLFISPDNTNYTEVGTNLVVQDAWQIWTFDVNWTARTTDVYLDGVLKASGVDCSADAATANGTIYFAIYGVTEAHHIAYIDYFKVGSDFSYPIIETTPNIIQADTFQTVTWDISATEDINKNAIDRIITTVVNADAANTFYVDNVYALNQHKRIILV